MYEFGLSATARSAISISVSVSPTIRREAAAANVFGSLSSKLKASRKSRIASLRSACDSDLPVPRQGRTEGLVSGRDAPACSPRPNLHGSVVILLHSLEMKIIGGEV